MEHRDPGVVDQRRQGPDRVLGAGQHLLVGADDGNVADDRDDLHALCGDPRDGVVDRRVALDGVQGDRVSRTCEVEGDGQADAAAGAGDQGRACRGGVHDTAPCLSSSRAMIMRWIWLVPS